MLANSPDEEEQQEDDDKLLLWKGHWQMGWSNVFPVSDAMICRCRTAGSASGSYPPSVRKGTSIVQLLTDKALQKREDRSVKPSSSLVSPLFSSVPTSEQEAQEPPATPSWCFVVAREWYEDKGIDGGSSISLPRVSQSDLCVQEENLKDDETDVSDERPSSPLAVASQRKRKPVPVNGTKLSTTSNRTQCLLLYSTALGNPYLWFYEVLPQFPHVVLMQKLHIVGEEEESSGDKKVCDRKNPMLVSVEANTGLLVTYRRMTGKICVYQCVFDTHTGRIRIDPGRCVKNRVWVPWLQPGFTQILLKASRNGRHRVICFDSTSGYVTTEALASTTPAPGEVDPQNQSPRLASLQTDVVASQSATCTPIPTQLISDNKTTTKDQAVDELSSNCENHTTAQKKQCEDHQTSRTCESFTETNHLNSTSCIVSLDQTSGGGADLHIAVPCALQPEWESRSELPERCDSHDVQLPLSTCVLPMVKSASGAEETSHTSEQNQCASEESKQDAPLQVCQVNKRVSAVCTSASCQHSCKGRFSATSSLPFAGGGGSERSLLWSSRLGSWHPVLEAHDGMDDQLNDRNEDEPADRTTPACSSASTPSAGNVEDAADIVVQVENVCSPKVQESCQNREHKSSLGNLALNVNDNHRLRLPSRKSNASDTRRFSGLSALVPPDTVAQAKRRLGAMMVSLPLRKECVFFYNPNYRQPPSTTASQLPLAKRVASRHSWSHIVLWRHSFVLCYSNTDGAVLVFNIAIRPDNSNRERPVATDTAEAFALPIGPTVFYDYRKALTKAPAEPLVPRAVRENDAAQAIDTPAPVAKRIARQASTIHDMPGPCRSLDGRKSQIRKPISPGGIRVSSADEEIPRNRPLEEHVPRLSTQQPENDYSTSILRILDELRRLPTFHGATPYASRATQLSKRALDRILRGETLFSSSKEPDTSQLPARLIIARITETLSKADSRHNAVRAIYRSLRKSQMLVKSAESDDSGAFGSKSQEPVGTRHHFDNEDVAADCEQSNRSNRQEAPRNSVHSIAATMSLPETAMWPEIAENDAEAEYSIEQLKSDDNAPIPYSSERRAPRRRRYDSTGYNNPNRFVTPKVVPFVPTKPTTCSRSRRYEAVASVASVHFPPILSAPPSVPPATPPASLDQADYQSTESPARTTNSPRICDSEDFVSQAFVLDLDPSVVHKYLAGVLPKPWVPTASCRNPTAEFSALSKRGEIERLLEARARVVEQRGLTPSQLAASVNRLTKGDGAHTRVPREVVSRLAYDKLDKEFRDSQPAKLRSDHQGRICARLHDEGLRRKKLKQNLLVERYAPPQKPAGKVSRRAVVQRLYASGIVRHEVARKKAVEAFLPGEPASIKHSPKQQKESIDRLYTKPVQFYMEARHRLLKRHLCSSG
ncbi:hypothetical protein DIPPA_55977 [Diplonema papillatum]|nr:hypothetical protein DIPPA_55977 [Diplonema papillatum]